MVQEHIMRKAYLLSTICASHLWTLQLVWGQSKSAKERWWKPFIYVYTSFLTSQKTKSVFFLNRNWSERGGIARVPIIHHRSIIYCIIQSQPDKSTTIWQMHLTSRQENFFSIGALNITWLSVFYKYRTLLTLWNCVFMGLAIISAICNWLWLRYQGAVTLY